MVTAILNGFRRGHNLTEQIESLKNQSIPPSEILVWYNHPDNNSQINYQINSDAHIAYCNYNFGVWARFAFALMAKSEYVCIFDDDTIPGRKWLENCINTMGKTEGLLGTIGLLYQNPKPPSSDECSYYEQHIRFGWANPNEEIKQVDIIGHSWFFKKEWLSDYWNELPDTKYDLCGEDMHFSYMLQKYRNIPTFVPPHPQNDIELWGSLKGNEYGADTNSIFESNKKTIIGVPFRQAMNEFFIEQRRKGWKLINDKF